jgi:hypothetical protein
MQAKLIITINLTSSSASHLDLEPKLQSIMDSIKYTCERELYDEDNKIVYTDYDEPQTCELDITVEEYTD